MDKNTLFVVTDNRMAPFLTKGTIVKPLKRIKGGRYVQDLQIVPNRGNGEWYAPDECLQELEHKYNIGNKVYSKTYKQIGTVACIRISLFNGFKVGYVVYYEEKSPDAHDGACKYFKGGKNFHYHFENENNLQPVFAAKPKVKDLIVKVTLDLESSKKLRQIIKDAQTEQVSTNSITIYRDGNKVVALDGEKRAIAKCNPTDTFDYYTSASIALLRLFTGAK